MKRIKQKLADGSISFYDACKKYYNELTEEDIDCIVERDLWGAALYLNNHSFFTQKHVDFIVKNAHSTPIKNISHRLSEENMTWLAENHPEILKEIFK